jgi:mycofactocin glycosyltransferase
MGMLPDGFGLAYDRSLRRFRDGTVLAGGHPGRVLTLTRRGAQAIDARVRGDGPGDPVDPDAAALAGRLVEAGMAHPRRGTAAPGPRDRTVVVPVHDRPDGLARCLRSLGTADPVLVVDDASSDGRAVADVCAAHGARLVVRRTNGGPARARNDALEAVDTELVAFVDSDCTVPPGWLDGLAWQFDDPAVAAVAPRVRPAPPPAGSRVRVVDRFGSSHSPLDLGPDEGEVGPDRAVRYVPTAALVVRRSAVASVGGFDASLRVGEDVDLVWRLVDAGWRVRYAPEVTASHAEPRTWSSVLARRYRYGTSAARLSRRHPARLAPVELRPWPTVATVAVLAGRPDLAAAAVAASAVVLARRVAPLGIPPRQAWSWSALGAGWTLVGIGRAATMLGLPAVALLACRSPRGKRAALLLVTVPPLVDWYRRRPDLDPVRWVAASVADDVAYGAGVWSGCLRTGESGPLRPAVASSTRSS